MLAACGASVLFLNNIDMLMFVNSRLVLDCCHTLLNTEFCLMLLNNNNLLKNVICGQCHDGDVKIEQ